MLWLLLLGEFTLCKQFMQNLRCDANDENSILCSDYAIRRINEPFIKDDDDKDEWAL